MAATRKACGVLVSKSFGHRNLVQSNALRTVKEPEEIRGFSAQCNRVAARILASQAFVFLRVLRFLVACRVFAAAAVLILAFGSCHLRVLVGLWA